MTFIYDRLYGKLSFPEIVRNLLNCPGLLRLREIGMGNIDFISFPSFSAVSRYEHSLGVCYLANLASRSLNLSKKDRVELMIAALYHDVTTPPFAHAMEEVLKTYYGFDHERHFYDLITRRSKDLGGGSYSQIFQGRTLKLPRFCQSSQAREIGIDLFRISRLVLGKDDDLLSSLICGDIDLDNIDNIIRAASAMGIQGASGHLSELLARSFVFYKGEEIAFSEIAGRYIEKWKKLREILYNMIMCSIDDFSLQAMLKHALYCLIRCNDEDIQIREVDWKLTEEEVFKRIREHQDTRDIYKRMRLRDLYECQGLVLIRGFDALEYIENKKNQQNLERLFEDVFQAKLILNYYKDKRQRDIQRLLVYFDEVLQSEKDSLSVPALLVGFFTSEHIHKDIGEKFIRRKRREEFIHRLRDELPDRFSLYDVRIDTQGRYPKIMEGEMIK